MDVLATEIMAVDVLGGVEVMTDGNGDEGCGCDGADKEEADKLHKRHNHRCEQIKFLHH